MRSGLIKLSAVALCFTLLFAIEGSARGPTLSRQTVPKVKAITEEEGLKVMEQLRHQQFGGDFVFFFDLEHIPRRGVQSSYEGVTWGTWNDQGLLTRTLIWKPGVRSTPLLQIIAQRGVNSEVWVWEPKIGVRSLSEDELSKPLLPDNHYSAFDLVMPFIFWDQFEYVGSKRLKNLPVHQFLIDPPESFKKARPELGRVLVSIDARFNALIRARLLGPSGEKIQTIEVLSFKKVDGQYILKQLDLFDEKTRDKSRFIVRAAAVEQSLDSEIFNPEFINRIPDTREIPFQSI